MLKRWGTLLALGGFAALASGISFAAHVRQECCGAAGHSAPVAPHSPDDCPVCQGLIAASTAITGGTVVVVLPIRSVARASRAEIVAPIVRYVGAPATPRAPPTA